MPGGVGGVAGAILPPRPDYAISVIVRTSPPEKMLSVNPVQSRCWMLVMTESITWSWVKSQPLNVQALK
jgi:hypothetical protein